MKKIFKISFVLAVAMTVFSCESFLDQQPASSISDEKAISNYNSALYALNGVYDALQSYNYYGRDFLVFGDCFTDNIIISPNNSNRFIAEGQWTITATTADLETFWTAAYKANMRANKILALIDNIDATDAQKASIKGQCLALRALIHFDLVRFFAQTFNGNESALGVPYIDRVIIYEKPARETVSDVYTKIITDLTESITLLTTGSALVTPPYNVTNWSAKALLAKVYMAQLNYTSALPVLQDIITNSGYTPLSAANYVAAWGKDHSTTAKNEFMFSINFKPDDYAATNCLGYIYLQTGYGDLRVPSSVSNLFTSTDLRKSLFIAGTGTSVGWNFNGKYPGKSGTTALADSPVIRLSDVYLMYAEANAGKTTPDITTAITYLDLIRKRADASAASTSSTISASDLLNAIFLERRKEFLYEGQYLFDLKRLKKTINSAYKSDNTLYTTITYPNLKLAMPIPQKEVDANPNMVQNQY
jgi:hypothetical protein